MLYIVMTYNTDMYIQIIFILINNTTTYDKPLANIRREHEIEEYVIEVTRNRKQM